MDIEILSVLPFCIEGSEEVVIYQDCYDGIQELFGVNYKNSLNTSVRPIMPSELPDVMIDYNGLRQYAREKGVPVVELTEEEKDFFVKKVEMEP